MPDVSDQLRRAIRAEIKAGSTAYRIAKDAGLKPEVVYRFMNEGLDLRLSTAAKLAAVLGLELRPAKKKNS
jgi:DNA-binding phage protein